MIINIKKILVKERLRRGGGQDVTERGLNRFYGGEQDVTSGDERKRENASRTRASCVFTA